MWSSDALRGGEEGRGEECLSHLEEITADLGTTQF